MKDKVFGVLQRVGRSFMLPIAILPVAGLLLGVGSSFTNATTIATYGLEGILGDGTMLHALLSIMSKAGNVIFDNLPLIFCRVRSQEQFIRFAEQLTKHHVKALTGINFPKFNAQNGDVYMFYLKQLNKKFGEILYGMPIIEDPEVAFKETRLVELTEIKKILDKYKDMIKMYSFVNGELKEELKQDLTEVTIKTIKKFRI